MHEWWINPLLRVARVIALRYNRYQVLIDIGARQPQLVERAVRGRVEDKHSAKPSILSTAPIALLLLEN